MLGDYKFNVYVNHVERTPISDRNLVYLIACSILRSPLYVKLLFLFFYFRRLGEQDFTAGSSFLLSFPFCTVCSFNTPRSSENETAGLQTEVLGTKAAGLFRRSRVISGDDVARRSCATAGRRRVISRQPNLVALSNRFTAHARPPPSPSEAKTTPHIPSESALPFPVVSCKHEH